MALSIAHKREFNRLTRKILGIYMGVFVAILLGSILYVGISGVASLEVSYHAFSKETGPSSQKKQG